MCAHFHPAIQQTRILSLSFTVASHQSISHCKGFLIKSSFPCTSVHIFLCVCVLHEINERAIGKKVPFRTYRQHLKRKENERTRKKREMRLMPKWQSNWYETTVQNESVVRLGTLLSRQWETSRPIHGCRQRRRRQRRRQSWLQLYLNATFFSPFFRIVETLILETLLPFGINAIEVVVY